MEQFKNDLKQTFNQSLLSYVSEYKLQLQRVVDDAQQMRTKMEANEMEWGRKYDKLYKLYLSERASRQTTEDENAKLVDVNTTLQTKQRTMMEERMTQDGLYKHTIEQLQEQYKHGKERWTSTVTALKEQHQLEMDAFQRILTDTIKKQSVYIDDLKHVIVAQQEDVTTLEQQIESMKKQIDELNIYKIQSSQLQSDLERERKTCATWKTAYFNQLPTKKR